MKRSLLHGIPEAKTFPRFACWMSSNWRAEVSRVARRQADWRPGFRDIDLLARGVMCQAPSHGVVLLYGEPALLVTRAETVLIAAVDKRLSDGLFRLETRYLCVDAATLVEELSLAALLRADLLRLAELNSRPALSLVRSSPENDDGRALEARPSRSTQKPYQVWPPITAGG